MRKVTWKTLFRYLKKHGCNCTLENTKSFCELHKLDFEYIEERLNDTGGFCDCEVLMNSMEHLDETEQIN